MTGKASNRTKEKRGPVPSRKICGAEPSMKSCVAKEIVRYDKTDVAHFIRTIRGQRVIMDADLARVYGVPTKALNQAVKRNIGKFPADFLFQLDGEEVMRSQNVTASEKRNVRYLPYAFTEHGAIMAASVLSSPKAVQMSVFVVRAFVSMRRMLVDREELNERLLRLEEKLASRLDGHETAIIEVLQQLMLLMNPPAPPPERPSKQIGYHVKEKRAAYNVRRAAKTAENGPKTRKNAKKCQKMSKKQ